MKGERQKGETTRKIPKTTLCWRSKCVICPTEDGRFEIIERLRHDDDDMRAAMTDNLESPVVIACDRRYVWYELPASLEHNTENKRQRQKIPAAPTMTLPGLFLTLLTAATAAAQHNDDTVSYTAFDSASWAITSDNLSPLLGANKQTLYDTFIDGCNEEIFQGNDTYKAENSVMECRNQDQYRRKMNSEQPTSVFNYTQDGYTKIRAPTTLMEVVRDFWNQNREKAEVEWKQTNVYHNTWDSPPTIVHLNKEEFAGGGPELQKQIWDMVQPVLEEWTGHYLSPVSLYGIRLYHNNSILAPHVDRMPLVTSAIGT